MARRMKRGTLILVSLVALFVLMQAVPYGRDHTNPPVIEQPAWDSPATEQLARRACFDCHSNETKWPWYSWIAPVSWRVQDHVDEGRGHLNFSRFDKAQRNATGAVKEVQEGDMPPWDYALAHSEARLSDAEKQQLIEGFKKTFSKAREFDPEEY